MYEIILLRKLMIRDKYFGIYPLILFTYNKKFKFLTKIYLEYYRITYNLLILSNDYNRQY